MADFSVVTTAVGDVLPFLIVDVSGNPVNLTNASVTARLYNGSTFALSVVNATSGTAEYTRVCNVFSVETLLRGYLSVSFGASAHYPTTNFTIEARKPENQEA